MSPCHVASLSTRNLVFRIPPMTISVQQPFVEYLGNSVATVFPYTFRILDETHLQVFIDGVLQSSGYTVSGVNQPNGGNVTFGTAPSIGAEISLVRVVTLDQQVDYQPFDAFPAETHERALDKLTMIVQENSGALSGAIRVAPAFLSEQRSMELPNAADRALKIVSFDQQGNVQVAESTAIGLEHGDLLSLADADHLQYFDQARGDGRWLELTGGVMTGSLTLPGAPTTNLHAATKGYVDTFVAGAQVTGYIADATGDAQGTIEAGWNAQANALGITRLGNEIIFYRWPSTGNTHFRSGGEKLAPTGWASIAGDWIQSVGVAAAPTDGFGYVRKKAAWANGNL